MSESADAFALATRSGMMRFPRFRRIEVGKRRRISFAKVLRRAEGEREVVTMGRGSIRPEVRVYSSSRSSMSWSSYLDPAGAGRDSSYLKSFRRDLSFEIEGSKGFPEARDAFSLERFSAMEASRRRRALLYR